MTTTVVVIGAGQSGLSAAAALRDLGVTPLVLEAGTEPVGSWPHYYDSLTLFSPARHSGLSGLPFFGDGDRYPHRDEVVEQLRRFAARLDVEIRTQTRVEAVHPDGHGGFVLHTTAGETISAAGVVAASGSFGNPHRPELPGQETFTGELSHVADYRDPAGYAGKRVVIVGAGNSAVQIAFELSASAAVTLATRAPLAFLPQIRDGRDFHDWIAASGFDLLPAHWLAPVVGGTLVVDIGDYRAALESGRIARKEMFQALDGDHVRWSDGTAEQIDAVLLATGYRPDLRYLEPIGALDASGSPLHIGGISTACPGLVYVGLELQRSFSSNTLRGVRHDVDHVVPVLAAHVRQAHKTVGF
ncbi:MULTISPECIES: flavin-containing monooxygenase [Actinoalloteichus]|uniref:Pyridine nucleotide-disulfide oxidoreductase n=1 Tax=Actinoalloteichus fjordicus TaxID=1612552 RepID=A0AAC9PTD3_9PSEU|nr:MULTISPECIES: NAD(P)-binding domain-containing protein [Actinoalloteichus]APU15922.1 Pyridine nucleotide-disulfide oxidoreductase [Actinoalloteichus fjordicus]APU21984.1 Pyridine nucleotide-disulfide oxidoreductase [Actinoalloteichus sp. GBA129-24]